MSDLSAHTIAPEDLRCPRCGAGAELVPSAEIYGRSYGGPRWRCADGCDAHVGCHPGTDEPLGTLADAEMREARGGVHAMLDRLWRTGRERDAIYAALAQHMGILPEKCHIGMFDVEQCQQARDWAIGRAMQQ